jgi:hypothetical protein
MLKPYEVKPWKAQAKGHKMPLSLGFIFGILGKCSRA